MCKYSLLYPGRLTKHEVKYEDYDCLFSLLQCLQNPDASKAKLISRMAKMGQPMLPFFTGPASHPDSSDSELEVRSNV